MTPYTLPAIVIHADWSMHPNRRRMTIAHRQPNDTYLAYPPVLVPEIHSFLPDIQNKIGSDGCALLGVDFSIGLPYAYAQLAEVNSFCHFLLSLNRELWKDFFEPCEMPDQISLHRPFYPLRPGGTSQAHLLNALGLESMDQLRRACEHATCFRKAASPIFWTMGAQQNGKATITGWRDLLIPGLQNPTLHLKIWPFDGDLFSLLQAGQIILAEAYPAEYYPALRIKFSAPTTTRKTGKRSQTDRAANAEVLFRAAAGQRVHLDPELKSIIRDGFGSLSTAEDAFDSTIGLLGLIAVLRGSLPSQVPLSSQIAAIEGWILGQAV